MFATASPIARHVQRSRNDALLVQAVKNELAKRGLRCDLFPVLRSQAGWDRPRFEAALAELTENAAKGKDGVVGFTPPAPDSVNRAT